MLTAQCITLCMPSSLYFYKMLHAKVSIFICQIKVFSVTYDVLCHSQDVDEFKKQKRPFLTQLFSPILLKVVNFTDYKFKISKNSKHLNAYIMLFWQAFSITFFGEWGDKSQVIIKLFEFINSNCFCPLILLSLISFSASYNWFSCRWKPCWCGTWWNHVSYAFYSNHLYIKSMMVSF